MIAAIPPPIPHSSQQAVSLSWSSYVSPVELGEGEDGEKAWPSINHSILSDFTYQPQSSVVCLFAPAVCKPSALLSPHRLPLNDQSIWINK
jgi:hypothetical protein